MSNRIFQEFYCTKSGGGCGGYFTVKINMGLNHIVQIVCPSCGHQHQRKIANGVIKEYGRFQKEPDEEICPPISAFSKEARSAPMKNRPSNQSERDGAVIEEPVKRSEFYDRWYESYGGDNGPS